jgi:2-oxoglutarate dehydrogenase E2 component (dihydrolipoamide succinyltransferase)
MNETRIVVPGLGESVVEATIARWLKKEGEAVAPGEPLVELETDKVNLEVGAERAGVLSRIERREGEDVKIGDLLGLISEGAEASSSAPVKTEPPPLPPQAEIPPVHEETPSKSAEKTKATPSARRLAQEHGIDLKGVDGTGSGNQITLQDVQNLVDQKQKLKSEKPQLEARATAPVASGERREERERLSRRRRTIAQRLVEAQHNAAMLTTYNEVDMSNVMELRKRHKDAFQKKYGVGLGIVSFFVKASIGALKEFPQINSELQGDELILKYYYDIGVAIGAEEGLVVPVLRDADKMSVAEIETAIRSFVEKSNSGTLSLEDLRGGTFTITNGGVFGSLMSTPILNPPQVAILGLHKIEERPVAQNGQVVIRPMMYLALSYDHRVVDGRESVQFLSRLKSFIEDPASLVLG